MCGILTYMSYEKKIDPAVIDLLKKDCLPQLAKRGPDAMTMDIIGPVALGHTRLSIIDIMTGQQPVYNETKTVACTLNGEIYNFNVLKAMLRNKGHVFKSQSDTEVIVHGYEEWGEEVFKHLNGMFAICIYDSIHNTLLVARDRMGEKPVLYMASDTSFACASEIKALLPLRKGNYAINKNAVASYLRFMCVLSPDTIFHAIKKLSPAHYIAIRNGNLSIKRYWEPDSHVQSEMTEEEFTGEFTRLFKESIRGKMISDVPLGAFLSGGIDSSAVVAFMARESSSPIKTFSVGFDSYINELPYARQIAEQYGTEHVELNVTFAIGEVLDEIVEYFDEPFADNSNIPTYLIAREARKYVTVVLTGDGGDELFAGYEGYVEQQYSSPNKWLRVLHKGADALTGHSLQRYLYVINPDNNGWSTWAEGRSIFMPHEIQLLHEAMPSIPLRERKWLQTNDISKLGQAYAFDWNYYLPDDLLKKVDMSSMMTSLETRAPFLDHTLLELSLQIPTIMKIKNNETKYLLKKVLSGYLPDSILRRRKQGFGVPISTWLKSDLKDRMREVLGEAKSGMFNQAYIKGLLKQFYSGDKHDWRLPHKLWVLFMYELWYAKYEKWMRR